MHPITVRTMKFDVPTAEEFHPLCVAGNSALSYTHLGTGLYVALVEPFIVKSLRRVKDRIRDEALLEDVDRFVRQETQHYQRHIDFNKVVLGHGYPGLQQRVEALQRDFDGYLENETDRFRIGYVEGIEAWTTQFAIGSLSTGLYDHPKTTRPIGELFKWHMVEEFEHRNVAFDVYEHLYRDRVHRARMCWFAQHHMSRFVAECMDLMSSADVPRHGERCRVTLRQKTLLAFGRLRIRARAMLPGYTPHAYAVPAGIAELSEHYTRLAVSTR